MCCIGLDKIHSDHRILRGLTSRLIYANLNSKQLLASISQSVVLQGSPEIHSFPVDIKLYIAYRKTKSHHRELTVVEEMLLLREGFTIQCKCRFWNLTHMSIIRSKYRYDVRVRKCLAYFLR